MSFSTLLVYLDGVLLGVFLEEFAVSFELDKAASVVGDGSLKGGIVLLQIVGGCPYFLAGKTLNFFLQDLIDVGHWGAFGLGYG